MNALLFFGLARHHLGSDTLGTYWLEDEKSEKVEPEVRKLPVSEITEVVRISFKLQFSNRYTHHDPLERSE